jgi:tetratricopeptide (TPR) repeat protein
MGCRIGKVVFFGAIVAGLSGEPIWAQQAPMCHSGDTAAEISTPEKLPVPLKMTGIGNSSMNIHAENEEAKVWFTQGLNLLHDFWDYEAAKAFEQSVRTDPKCAMCYWGLYQAGVFRSADVPWAQAALDRAVALKKHGSKADQIYIEAAVVEHKVALEELHSKPKAKKPEPVDGAPHADSEETKLYRKLVAIEPEDVQARIFLASSLRDGFDKKGEPRAGTREADEILSSILKQHPDDTAANHYWIHAVEPGNHPELALGSAKKLGELTPASGHMVHMPGHIFYRTGDYETARDSFLVSMHVDETYMRTQGVGVANDWNYVHNLMYLIADLMEAGRVTEAMKISEKLTKARGEVGPTLYRQTPRDGMSRLSVELPVLLRAGVWESAVQALERSSPDPSLKTLAALREAMLEYTRGMAALAHGENKAAAAMSDDLDVRVKQKPVHAPEDMPGMAAMSMSMSKDAMAKPVHSYLDVAAMELRASVLLADGRGVESDAMFTKAAEAEKELGYREPPFYIRPVEETRGDALLRAKRYDEAKQAYEAALKQRPESGFALFGVAQADAGANRRSAATADYAHLLTVWAKADSDLPQLVTARAWMTRQAVDGE